MSSTSGIGSSHHTLHSCAVKPSISERIHHQVDSVVTKLAFGHQFNQINEIENSNSLVANKKRESLKNHIKTLTTFDKFKIFLKLLAEKINFIRSAIMLLIHPATFKKTFNKMSKDFCYHTYLGEMVDFYTKDHQQLNGMIIYGSERKDKNKPVFMMCPGNEMTYESWIYEAQCMARQNDVNILLYNHRGIGLSLGHEHSTDNAVEDCKATIKYAIENLCQGDPEKLGVLGLSLGGGISATALKELQDEEALQPIGLYVNLRSFSSLPQCIKGFMGLNASVGKVVFKILNLNPLDAGKALLTKNLANKTVVITAEKDQIMKGEGRLSNYLQKKLSKETKKNNEPTIQPLNLQDNIEEIVLSAKEDKHPIEIEYYTEPNKTHGDYWDENYIRRLIKESISQESELENLAL